MAMKVGESLTDHVREKEKRDQKEDGDQRGALAAKSRVEVEGDTAMLELLGGVPEPHVEDRLGSSSEGLGMLIEPIGNHGGGMLNADGERQKSQRVDAFGFATSFALEHASGHGVVEALGFKALIEKGVNAAMNGLLGDESLGDRLPRGASRLRKKRKSHFDRVNEVLLANGEGERERVE